MTKDYLIVDYTQNEDNPILKLIDEKEVFANIDCAKDQESKIVIYKLGDCLIDWS